jgi:hypothetical protein|tara:strand:+ start:269 stop:427 length:159 start_codon:yes stop_codon:yes gene_type:complete
MHEHVGGGAKPTVTKMGIEETHVLGKYVKRGDILRLLLIVLMRRRSRRGVLA